MKYKSNVKGFDINLRLIVSFFLVVLSVYIQSYLLILIGVYLFFTGLKKYCFIYDVFRINSQYTDENYYMTYLPKYNPSAVFIFNSTGEIKFQNKSAKNDFKEITNFSDFDSLDMTDIIQNNKSDILYYKKGKLSFQLDIIGTSEINSLLVYATDISEMTTLNEEIENTQKEIIYTMGEIGESRSKETGNHVKRVANYSEILALLYGLNKQEAEMLKMASPMHDIGKVGIPDSILNKPGRHTVDEFKIMQTHAQLGYDMLKNSDRPIIKAAAIVSLQHHEKYDGSGYPRGLVGEDIHIYGRITAIADVFDALGSKRVYKEAWELDKILELFISEKGKQFDPKLIDLFMDNLDEFLKIRDSYTDV